MLDILQPEIAPVSSLGQISVTHPDYRVLGSWKVNAEPPGLPTGVVLSEVYKFAGARVDTPYRPSASYQAVQFTNAHGLTIPQVCLVTNYGVGTSVIAVTQILLDEVKTNSTVRDFCLPITARGHIQDERFVADASPFRFNAVDTLPREQASR